MLVQQLRDDVLSARHCHLRRRPVTAVPRGRISAMLNQNLHDVEVALCGSSVQGSAVHATGAVHGPRKLNCEVFHKARDPAQRGVIQWGGRGLLRTLCRHRRTLGVVDVMQPHPGGEGLFLGEDALDAQLDVLPLGDVAVPRVQQPVLGGVVRHREDLDGLPGEQLGQLVVEMQERRDARLRRDPVRVFDVAEVPSDPFRDNVGHDAFRVEKLGHGHVPELHPFDAVDPVRPHQVVTHGENIRLWSLGVPYRLILGRCASVVIDREDL